MAPESRKQMKRALQLPSLLLEGVSRPGHRKEEPKRSPMISQSGGDMVEIPGRLKRPELIREYQKGESSMKREIQKTQVVLEYLAEY